MERKEALMGRETVIAVIVTKHKISQLGKRDSASLSGLALILVFDTDKARYNVQQLRSHILTRYYI